VVLAKALYAHIVIRHSRLPAANEVPERFLPLPAARRRLQPHVDRIVSDFVSVGRQLAYYDQLLREGSYGDAASRSVVPK
jgi:hypothetical protein